MKLYHDYKKLFNTVFLVGFFIIPIVFLSAQTIDEINNKINQKNTDIAQLEQEIKQYQAQLDDLAKQKSSLDGSIKQLDLTRKKLVTDISITESKISKTNLKLQELSLDIFDKQESISGYSDAIAEQIKITNEFELNSIIGNILSEEKISNVWNDIDNMINVRDKIRKQIISVKEVKNNLEIKKKETESAKKELLSLKTKLADQKKIVEQNANEKKKLLKQTKNNETNYQKLLKDRLAKKVAFEKELSDYESQLKYILDPSKLPNGGVLSWPLDYVYITQFFGKTEAGKRLYANGTHNGVDFRAPVGTPLKAMADGVVLGVGDTDITCPNASFGKFVFIQYNNGLSSTYGHLSLIKTYEGDKVNRGEIIGYTGNTGYSTGPHLHLSLYASGAVKMESRPSKSCDGRIYRMPISPVNAYLDAMYYLPPYKK